MRAFVLSGLLIVLSLPGFPQARHSFTFEDMMALKRVEEPEPSPDGKWVLFAAVDVDLKANTKTPHVWIVPLDTHVSQQRVDVGHPAEGSEEKRSLRIRMPIDLAGRRMESASRSFQQKKAARRFGLRISTVRPVR